MMSPERKITVHRTRAFARTRTRAGRRLIARPRLPLVPRPLPELVEHCAECGGDDALIEGRQRGAGADGVARSL
eukprot:5154978-Pleurochrysis_carterae.AAC.1